MSQDCQFVPNAVTNCDDAVACTDNDLCVVGVCVGTTNDANCDDGEHCNGLETCDTLADCQAGTPPFLDDGVACTVDSCDEIGDVVVHTPFNALCNNGLFCDGTEICDPVLDCQAGGDPCPGQGCNEVTDACDLAGGDTGFLSSGSNAPRGTAWSFPANAHDEVDGTYAVSGRNGTRHDWTNLGVAVGASIAGELLVVDSQGEPHLLQELRHGPVADRDANGPQLGGDLGRSSAGPLESAHRIARRVVLHQFFDALDDFRRFFSSALRPTPALRTRFASTSCCRRS